MYARLSEVHLVLSWAMLALLVLCASRRGWRKVPAPALPLRSLVNASVAAQVATSLLLYLRFSPYTAGVRANVEVVLRDSTLRYWNVLHPLLGLLALGCSIWAVNRRGTSTPAAASGLALAGAALLTAALMR